MKNALILVSGMPATGKTTFASWLSKELRAPLVCYDNIKKKTFEILNRNINNLEQNNLFGAVAYDFFLFSIEEVMTSSTLLIAEYFFSDQMKDTFHNLITKYQYETITVHMDCPVEVAHQRFHERNLNSLSHNSIRPTEIPITQFTEVTKQNKDFRFGNRFIYVDTSDFSAVSYDNILAEIKCHLGEFVCV
ncbi:MAG: ATP-binding protein [Defluviitaleaceae bacterium]|nr:ATP-binding protein [Defluviitaleaceae bacterium]